MRCPSCNHDNPADASFCEECGAKLELICPACKASVSPGARFCKKCGTAIGPTKAAASTTVSSPKSQIIVAADFGEASEAIDGERKTVTALFADIKGSTELMEDLDPEEARAIIDPALKLMIDAVHRYDGYVVQSTGDGIFALFGAPVAHEDHPQRRSMPPRDAGGAATARQSARRGRHPIQGRVGINTGEVVVRSIQTGRSGRVHADRTYHQSGGADADRRPGRFDRGQRTDARLVEGYFDLKPLGATKVKGVSEPVNVYEVTGLGPLRTRLQRRSAARADEVRRARARDGADASARSNSRARDTGRSSPRWRRRERASRGCSIEFKATLPAECMVLEAYSVSHGKASA